MKKISAFFLIMLLVSTIWFTFPCKAEETTYYYVMFSADKTGSFNFSIELENNEVLRVSANVEQQGDLKVFTSLSVEGNEQYYYVTKNHVYRPDKVLPYALVTLKKPKGLTIGFVSLTLTVQIESETLTLYWMKTSYPPSKSEEQPAPQPFDILGGIQAVFNFFANLGGFATSVIDFFTRIPQMFIQAFTFIGGLIGHTGDPSLLTDISTYKLQLTTLTTNAEYGRLAQQALDGKIPLGNVAHLISVKREHYDKTLTQLENSAPTGFLGLFCSVWSILTSQWFRDIIIMIVKNFVLINVVIVCSIVVLGMVETIKKRSMQPVLNSVVTVKNYFLAYYKFGSWLFTTAYRILQLVVQVLDVIIPF